MRVDRRISRPLIGQILRQGLHLPRTLKHQLGFQFSSGLSLFLTPVSQPTLVLRLQTVCPQFGCMRFAQGFLDAGTSLVQRLQHRFVEKALEYPEQDQEVDDLKRESGPVDVHDRFKVVQSMCMTGPI